MTKPSAIPTTSWGRKEKDKVQTGGVGKLYRGTNALKLHNLEVELSLCAPLQTMGRPKDSDMEDIVRYVVVELEMRKEDLHLYGEGPTIQ